MAEAQGRGGRRAGGVGLEVGDYYKLRVCRKEGR
jgi:hypothetical protein